MSRPLTPEAASALTRALETLGVRPFKGGSLTLHWGRTGRLEAIEERRHMQFSHETIASPQQGVHTEQRDHRMT